MSNSQVAERIQFKSGAGISNERSVCVCVCENKQKHLTNKKIYNKPLAFKFDFSQTSLITEEDLSESKHLLWTYTIVNYTYYYQLKSLNLFNNNNNNYHHHHHQ